MRALQMLMGEEEYHRWFQNLKGVAGVSAGALYGLMFALRLSPEQVDNVKKNIDLRRCVSFANIDQCHTKLGFSDMNEVRRYVHFVLEEGGLSKNATMSDLFRFTRLPCVFRASNITARKAENISHSTHASMRIDDAICASCAIPLLYHPVAYRGALLVDGCLTGSVADVFTTSETMFVKIEIPNQNNAHDTRGLVDYISSLFAFASNQANTVDDDEMFVLRLRNTSGFDPYASQEEIETDGMLSAFTMFTGIDVSSTCGQLCREYVRNVWEFTEDEELPPEEVSPPCEDDRSESTAP